MVTLVANKQGTKVFGSHGCILNWPKEQIQGVPDLVPKKFTVLNVKMEFVKDGGAMHTSVDGAEHHLERVTAKYEELLQNKYKYRRCQIDA